jgi:hydroxymethylbilane synthase
MPLRLATRASPLAQWQARHVAALLAPYAACDLVPVQTHGDRDQATALRDMGGFGAFTKAIQQALTAGRADVAVHSLKDLPTDPNPGTVLAGTPARGPTGDAFLSLRHPSFDRLPAGAVVGTSSLRRRAMLLARRPDLTLVELRGNIDTRLRKLAELGLDAIVLAEAGLVRLGLAHRIVEVLDPGWLLPAVGQGAIGLEARTDDPTSRQLAEGITDPPTWAAVTAERAMLFALGGGCLVPVGVTAAVDGGELRLRALVLSGDGRRQAAASHRGPAERPLAVGQELAAMLLAEGADELLTDRRPSGGRPN